MHYKHAILYGAAATLMIISTFFLQEVRNTYMKHKLIKESLNIQVIPTSNNQLRFTIQNYINSPPVPMQFPFSYPKDNKLTEPDYYYKQYKSPISFDLYRKDGQMIFSSIYFDFDEHLVQIGTILNEDTMIWGLGERRQEQFLLQTGEYTIWNHDQFSTLDDGNLGKQLYGYHPVLLQRSAQGLYHIILFRSTNAIKVKYDEDSQIIFTFTGGPIDIYFIIGQDDADELIKEYHKFINGWKIHPFWAQGYQQSRWGNDDITYLKEYIRLFDKYQIPLDVVYSDAEYTYQMNSFTVNTTAFPPDQLKKLQNLSDPLGVHWVPIIDPAFKIGANNSNRGIELDVFIKSNYTKDYLIACSWAHESYFVDYNHPNAGPFLNECLTNLTTIYNINPSGLWIDMNEFSNFNDGEITSKQKCETPFTLQLIQDGFDLPFNPNGNIPLNNRTISLNSLHYNQQDSNFLYYDNLTLYELEFHVLNGFGETKLINQYQPSKVNFLLSRSTYVGSGQFAAHWGGDIEADWQNLRASIPSIFNFQLFGIPMVGDDICGFNGNTTAELCARWIQLGAFTPLSRNHNRNSSKRHEPYAFNEEYVLKAFKNNLGQRYQLLKYIYLQFVRQYDQQLQNGAGSVFKPLFFKFGYDPKTLKIDDQFLLGDYLMIAPILQKGVDKRKIYFPEGYSWYDWKTGQRIKGGQVIEFELQLWEEQRIFQREGSIVQVSESKGVMRSRYLNKRDKVRVALNEDNEAFGEILMSKQLDESYVENVCLKDYWSCISEVRFKNGEMVMSEGWEGQKVEIDWIWS